jgi:hypothetical protein
MMLQGLVVVRIYSLVINLAGAWRGFSKVIRMKRVACRCTRSRSRTMAYGLIRGDAQTRIVALVNHSSIDLSLAISLLLAVSSER